MRRLLILMLAIMGSSLSQVALADVWLAEMVHPTPGFAATTEPRLVADDQDALHLIFHDFDIWAIRYCSNASGSWTQSVVDSIGLILPWYDLVVGEDGTPHVVYLNGVGNLILAAKNGADWSYTTIDTTTSGIQHIALSLASDGSPWIAYATSDEILFASKMEEQWSSTTIASLGDCDFFRMFTDQLGRPVIGLKDDDTNQLTVLTGAADLSTWDSDPLDLSGAPPVVDFALDGNGDPHWLYYDMAQFKIIMAANTGSGWTDEPLDTPMVMWTTPFAFGFDDLGEPGFAFNTYYVHREGGDWIWRDNEHLALQQWTALAYIAGDRPYLYHIYDEQIYLLSHWPGDPVMDLAETSHIWTEGFTDWDLMVGNTGVAPLIIDDYDYASGGIDDTVFPLVNETFPFVVMPQTEDALTIRFQPPDDQTHFDQLILSTNDPLAPGPEISLEGTAEGTVPGGTLPVYVRDLFADLIFYELNEDYPLPDARVSLYQGGVLAHSPITTSSGGVVTHTGVTPGDYEIVVTSEFLDPAEDPVSKTVTVSMAVSVADGINPPATVVVPDSLMTQAYYWTYRLSDIDEPLSHSETGLLTLQYPAAEEARDVLDTMRHDMTPEASESVARMILAHGVTEEMFHGAYYVGDKFIIGIAQVFNFLHYSSTAVNRIIQIIEIIWHGIFDRMAAMMDILKLMLEWMLQSLVDAAINYAISLVPCDPGDIICPRDIVEIGVTATRSHYDGVSFSFSDLIWAEVIEEVYAVMQDAFIQMAYVEMLTDSDLAEAVERTRDLEYEGTFHHVGDHAYDSIEEDRILTDTVGITCYNLILAAHFLRSTSMILDAVDEIPGLGMLGGIASIMEMGAWFSLGSSLGLSGGIFFTQPLRLEDTLDEIYYPYGKGSEREPPPGCPAAVLTRDRIDAAQIQLTLAREEYGDAVAEVRQHVDQDNIIEAGLALEDLMTADRALSDVTDNACAPIRAVALAAIDQHEGFSVAYDSLLSKQTTSTSSRFLNYVGVLLLPADDSSAMKDSVLGYLDRSVTKAAAMTSQVSAVLDTVADMPVPAIVQPFEVVQTAPRLTVGRVDTISVRLRNPGGVTANDVSAVLRVGGAMRVIGADSLHVSAIEPGGQTESLTWFVELVDATATIGTWTLSIDAPGAYTSDANGRFKIPEPVSPGTGGVLSSANVYSYPNPFDPTTGEALIRFSLENDTRVSLQIFDSGGQLVRNLLLDEPETGGVEIAIPWNGRNGAGDLVANGVYFAVIQSDSGERAVCKIVVMR